MLKITDLFFLVLCLCGCGIAFAGLGENEASIEKDMKVLASRSHAKSSGDSYTVHEIDKGMTTVKEYVGQNGKVFAVTWQGKSPPDLNALLGTYLEEYKAVFDTRPKQMGRHPAETVKSQHVVVSRSGSFGSFHGCAYVPSLLPAGEKIDGCH